MRVLICKSLRSWFPKFVNCHPERPLSLAPDNHGRNSAEAIRLCHLPFGKNSKHLNCRPRQWHGSLRFPSQMGKCSLLRRKAHYDLRRCSKRPGQTSLTLSVPLLSSQPPNTRPTYSCFAQASKLGTCSSVRRPRSKECSPAESSRASSCRSCPSLCQMSSSEVTGQA